MFTILGVIFAVVGVAVAGFVMGIVAMFASQKRSPRKIPQGCGKTGKFTVLILQFI